DRTDTPRRNKILSLARLPIPPYWQILNNLEAATGFEPVVEDLQSSALPLGYAALRKESKRKTGFEPATPTLARWCSTTELLPQQLAGLLGFEPRNDGIKTRCLTAWLSPNKYKWGGWWDSNPRVPEPQSGALTASPQPPYLNIC